jgi:hypothetical protein
MNPSSSVQAAPPLERIVTNWRRFSSGLWRVSEGYIAAAYSVSTLPKVQTFTHEGRFFTNGGSCFSKCVHAEVQGYPLIPADEYCGAESVPYSYQGREVVCKGKIFRLGEQVLFVASDPTIDEWRCLLRSLYADGGLFAADCTYAEFLLDRFDPKSEAGNAARFKELAECGAQPMPRIQDEMRRLLEQEKGFANQPQQIDFAL